MGTSALTSCCVEALEPRMLLSGDTPLAEQLVVDMMAIHYAPSTGCSYLESM